MSYSEVVKQKGEEIDNKENKNKTITEEKLWSEEMEEFGNIDDLSSFPTKCSVLENQLETILRKYVNCLFQEKIQEYNDNTSTNQNEAKLKDICFLLFNLISDNVNSAITAATINFPQKDGKLNCIEIECKNEKKMIIIRGNKNKYGLIVGAQGKKLNEIKTRYNIDIYVPSKFDKSNEIKISGDEYLKAAFNIIEKIK